MQDKVGELAACLWFFFFENTNEMLVMVLYRNTGKKLF